MQMAANTLTLKRGQLLLGAPPPAAVAANGKNSGGIIRKHSMMHQRLLGAMGNGNSGSSKVCFFSFRGAQSDVGPPKNVQSNGAISEYGTLPPQQRVRKLEAKIKELQADLSKREQSKEGMAKMHAVYTDNPKLGSAENVAAQMRQFDKASFVVEYFM